MNLRHPSQLEIGLGDPDGYRWMATPGLRVADHRPEVLPDGSRPGAQLTFTYFRRVGGRVAEMTSRKCSLGALLRRAQTSVAVFVKAPMEVRKGYNVGGESSGRGGFTEEIISDGHCRRIRAVGCLQNASP